MELIFSVRTDIVGGAQSVRTVTSVSRQCSVFGPGAWIAHSGPGTGFIQRYRFRVRTGTGTSYNINNS